MRIGVTRRTKKIASVCDAGAAPKQRQETGTGCAHALLFEIDPTSRAMLTSLTMTEGTSPADRALAARTILRIFGKMNIDKMRHAILNSPLAHTYSIVARDADTGELGVAVQSHYFSVGSVVTWAEAAVGAVATQSLADPSYGKLGLDLMRAGRSAPDALAGLVASDAASAVRQVAMIDGEGRVAAHTGAMAIAEAGHIVGDGFSVQANMMLRATVWPAMAEAYKAAEGELVDRLLAALDAAEAEGGDIRGRQSAAILIVAGKNTGRPWSDTVYNVRVDDAPEPLVEIRRLVSVARAYSHMRLATNAVERGDFDTLSREFETATRLVGDNPEMRFWHGIGLLSAGKVAEGIAILREVAAVDRNWITLALRLPTMMLPVNEAVKDQIRKIA